MDIDMYESSERTPRHDPRGKATGSVAAIPTPSENPVPLGVGSDVDSTLLKGAYEVKNNLISNLHAVIIGINDYPHLSKLKGAVADANEVASFLGSELNIPGDRITNLRDGAATRRNIIDSIKSLMVNPHINNGDPILIYYAGHGGSKKATEEWKEENGAHEVQVIFPFDYNTESSGSPGLVECIPDRTIAGLLNELSAAKGDNITVIFDSCHSASGTREPIKLKPWVLDRRERSAEVLRDIPWDIDSDIVRPELGIVPPPKEGEKRRTYLPLCVNQTSHILLAACGSEEKAWEEDGRGVFTVALLKSIRANGVDKITYNELIKSLTSLSCQSPHCYGKHQDRILFNSRVPSRSTRVIPVEFMNGEIVLQVGAASGVVTKSIWEIYPSVTGDVSLGTFQAGPPKVSTTVLTPVEQGGDALYLAHIYGSDRTELLTYARQVKVGEVDDLRVYFTPQTKERMFGARNPESTASYTVGSAEREVGYVVHDDKDTADVAVDLYCDLVIFRLCDRQAEKYKVADMERSVRLDRRAMEDVLFGAAKWKWHLQRRNIDSGDINDLVTMELVRMGEKPGELMELYPEEERTSMNMSGIVDLEVKEGYLYGIKLTSRVEQPVYIRMFYFDSADFSITDMFGHSTGKDTVINANGTFVIGDNAVGGTPLQFMLDVHQQLDLGYMKVFWSTEPLDLVGLEQQAVFSSREWRRQRGCSEYVGEGVEWGTTLLTLVQRRPQKPV